MSDEAQPQEADPFAELSEEQRKEVEATLAIEAAMRQHVCLPVQFNLICLEIPDQGPGVVLQTRTPAGSQNLVLTREAALQMASALRKAAQTGPVASKLIVPHGLAVPG